MTRYAVFGAGLMGRVMARDLVESEPDAEVALCDIIDACCVTPRTSSPAKG
jgi:prephenate dehydrogenase